MTEMFLQLRLLLSSLSLVALASANYQIGFVFRNFTLLPPTNTLFNGSCCDTSCGTDMTCCTSTSCSPTLRLCFRESGHPRDNTDCPLLQVARTVADQQFAVLGTDNAAIRQFYNGGFQVYIRISHLEGQNPDFSPPFTDPLIDEAFLEFQLPAVTFENRLSRPNTEILIENGEFGRIRIELQTSVHCAEGFNGTGCELFCNPQCQPGLAPPPPPPLSPLTTTSAVPLQSTGSSNTVAIALGVSLGVVVFHALVIAIVAVIIMWRKKKSKKPTTKTRSQRRLSKSDIQVVTSLEPLTRGQLYTTVNKKRKGISDDSSEEGSPPPVPPYVPDETHNGVVYQNFSMLQQKK